MICQENISASENFPLNCCEALITDAVCGVWSLESSSYPTWGKWWNGWLAGWRMEDGGMTNQSESAGVISVSVVYFYITSVHPRGNLTSREWSVSPFPSLRGSGFISKAMMNSQQTPTPYGPWVSMHLNEPSLPLPHTTQGFLNSLSLVKHYIKHNNNSRPSPPSSPHPPFSTSFFKSFSSLTFFFLVHITKGSFHLLFMMDSSTSFLKHLTSHPSLLPLSIKPQRVVRHHS